MNSIIITSPQVTIYVNDYVKSVAFDSLGDVQSYLSKIAQAYGWVQDGDEYGGSFVDSSRREQALYETVFVTVGSITLSELANL